MSEDPELIEQLYSKDKQSFELVFRQYYPELCRFALKYVSNQSDAEELVQDVFVGLWHKLDSITIKISLKSYLYTCVRNTAFNALKHQKVRDIHTQYVSRQADISVELNVLEVKELNALINQTIESLPDRCQAVFKLSRFEHKKYQEIAEEMNISVKTVEAQMGKALRVLRTELGSYLPISLLVWVELFMNG